MTQSKTLANKVGNHETTDHYSKLLCSILHDDNLQGDDPLSKIIQRLQKKTFRSMSDHKTRMGENYDLAKDHKDACGYLGMPLEEFSSKLYRMAVKDEWKGNMEAMKIMEKNADNIAKRYDNHLVLLGLHNIL